MMASEEEIWNALKPIQDPELFISIVDLGLIYKVECDETTGKVRLEMTLTSPACPLGPIIRTQAHAVLTKLSGVKDVQVDLVWNPPWDPRTMASEDAKLQLGLV